nr:hypothetical protein [Anaerolineae bacterium]
VKLEIVTAGDPVIIALADLLVTYPPHTISDVDEQAVQAEIDRAYINIPPVSDAIVEERHEGP